MEHAGRKRVIIVGKGGIRAAAALAGSGLDVVLVTWAGPEEVRLPGGEVDGGVSGRAPQRASRGLRQGNG